MSHVQRAYFSTVHRAKCFLVNNIVMQAMQDKVRLGREEIKQLHCDGDAEILGLDQKSISKLLLKRFNIEKKKGRYGQSKSMIAAAEKLKGTGCYLENVSTQAKLKDSVISRVSRTAAKFVAKTKTKL